MASTEALSSGSQDHRIDDFQYQPLSSGAVASLVLGLLSGLVFLAGRDSFQASLMICPIPVIGMVIGLRALRRIRSESENLSGGGLALAGILLSIFCLVVGIGYSGYVYGTEVPENYLRTSFAEFRPDEVEIRGNVYVPEDIGALDGKSVFIKGYMREDSISRRRHVGSFLLVRDNNQCCFGDLSKVKYFDQVLVKVDDSLNLDYSSRLFRIGGTLHVLPENALKKIGHPVYLLDADYAR